MKKWTSIALVALFSTIVLTGCSIFGGGDEAAEGDGTGDGAAAAAKGEGNKASEAGGKSGSSAGSDLDKKRIESLQEEIDSLTEDLNEAKAGPTEAEIAAKVRADIEQEVRAAVQKDLDKVSLERARLLVVRYAQQNKDVYGDHANEPLVWEVATAEEQDEFYYVKLSYKPFSDFGGAPGLEEFIVEKDGAIAFRQVLSGPDATKTAAPAPAPAPKPAS